MSDRSDAVSVSITTLSRVLVGDTVCRPFMVDELEEARRRVAELANETIAGSDMVGDRRDKHGVYQRSSRPELGDAEYQSAIAQVLDALPL
jgi:hypothetical protein